MSLRCPEWSRSPEIRGRFQTSWKTQRHRAGVVDCNREWQGSWIPSFIRIGIIECGHPYIFGGWKTLCIGKDQEEGKHKELHCLKNETKKMLICFLGIPGSSDTLCKFYFKNIYSV
ncbi:hypothetical protein MT325_m353L [Paramecium bursaria chlorella virus MT325]|uniref:Uncharacterized protein m353L n=2 Tax=Paramecium bursaria Chlorella virus A1 TaxID=381899 RepID=A7IU83_PBCVM|nr:hypothetical protein FR483_n363L [Paramecium bursaria Chlorella virus FR483]ABT13907.1 hypothetical protein MT325_m353L [Paramecium bursaria chlorella virus MT325]ABT15648.1 hypothetical protein FR483_n363L [Paramecium bursaria Chlorella virus FR483]